MPLGFYVARLLDKFIPGKSNRLVNGMLNTAARRYENKATRHFLRVTLPDLFSRAEGLSNSGILELEQQSYRMAARINNVARRTGISHIELGKILDTAYRSGDYSKIPDAALRDVVQEAADTITNLSKRLMEAGVMDNAMLETVRSQLGQYMHLSYSKFHVNDWAKRVQGTAVWHSGLEYFKKTFPNMSDDEIIGTMMYLVNQGRPATFGGTLKTATEAGAASIPKNVAEGLPKPVLDELLRRANIPAAVQDLMGLERDFVTNFQVTSAKMLYDITMAAFDKTMIEQGLKTGVFTVGKTASNHVEMNFPRVFSRPLYTTPEMAYALGSIDATGAALGPWRIVTAMASAVKFGKVALSPPTMNRNLFSLAPMVVSNGTALELIRNPRLGFKATKMAAHIISQRIQRSVLKSHKIKPLPQSLQNEILEAVRHDLVGTGAMSGEMQLWLGRTAEILDRQGMRASSVSSVTSAAQGVANVAGDVYLGIDDFAKITSWLAKKSQLSRWKEQATKGGYLDDFNRYMLDQFGHPSIEKAAADFTKDTIQHFPYTSPIAKDLSVNPLVAPFASFAAEMPRTQFMTVKHALKELQWAALNPASPMTRRVAAEAGKKIAGVYVAANMWGMLAAGYMDDDDQSDEREAAIREMVAAPWQVNSDLIWEFNDDGTITLIDPGYTNPYSEIRKMWVSAVSRPGTMQERMTRFATQLEESYLGREIVVEGLLETVMGSKMGGSGWSGVLFEEGQEFTGRRSMGHMAERLYHLFSATAPGGVTWSDRIVRQVTEGKRGFGAIPDKAPSYDMGTWQMAMSFFGAPTSMTIDPARATWFKFQGHLNDLESTRKDFRSQYRNSADKAETLEFYREEWEEINAEIVKSVHHAKVLGVNNFEIKRQLSSRPGVFLKGPVLMMLLGEQTVPFGMVYPLPRQVQ
jgi:hypothetical protein